jgi:hypothetical protein
MFRKTEAVRPPRRLAILAAITLLSALPAAALQPKDPKDPLDAASFSEAGSRLVPHHADLKALEAAAVGDAKGERLLAAFEAFEASAPGPWRIVWDRATGYAALLEGRGIPWIPGSANSLTPADLGLSEGATVPLELLEAKARAFLAANPDLLGVPADSLVLRKGASGPFGDSLFYVELGLEWRGVPVEQARVVFRIDHGNLVQIGQEGFSDALRDLPAKPTVDKGSAWLLLDGQVGSGHGDEEILEPGRLVVMPTATREALSGAIAVPGSGIAYRLVWVVAFRRPGVVGSWEARIDASTGELVSFLDVNDYGRAHGGTYAGDRPSPEVDRPFPFVDVASGVSSDGSGRFSGNDATSSLAGPFVQIVDECGTTSLTTTDGDLDFGSSPGVDCDTPGFGGDGNSHSARTQFYNVNMILQKARGWLPSNGWLTSQILDFVNIGNVCNAYWQPLIGSLNFFVSGAGCENTGELPGVSLHEFGHGLDQNDGNGSSPDNGTGETYGDFTAALETHSSCTGNGFFLSGQNCGGYGDPCTGCSGVRDIDSANHSSGQPAVPSMLGGTTGFHCSLNAGYKGPCGYEGHCESYISSEALWDLALRDLPAAGIDGATAWQLVDRLWYLSRPTATAAYACPTTSTTDGCGAGSLFTVLRAADDTDGDLSNGTPHAAAIYAAFARHSIACGSAGDPSNQDQSSCPTLAAATLAATPGSDSASLSWTAVPGADHYVVYRNESGCDAGFRKVGSTSSPLFTDSGPANGVTYFYRVQASGSSEACTGPMSGCATVTPWSCRGTFTLAKRVVRCTDSLEVVLTDVDLAGSGSVSIQAFSTVESAPESLLLTESPASSGRFVGSVSTTTTVSAGDGKVGVAGGATLTLRYADTDSCGTGPATIDAPLPVDCASPVISNVASTTTEQSATITWTTNEPATSRVTWGTSAPPTVVVESTALVTSHQVTIPGLSACTNHLFGVTSADEAGNGATSDNGGAWHSFGTKGLGYVLRDDVESGAGGWTVVTNQGSAWHIDSCRSSSATHSWKAGSTSCPGTYASSTGTYLVSPLLDLGGAGHGYTLRFHEWGSTEADGYGQIRDSCHVQGSIDGGQSWQELLPPYGGSSNGWVFTTADLAPLTGNAVKVRFWLQADYDWNYEGWYLDDIEISKPSECAADLHYQSFAVVQDSCTGSGAGSGNGVVDAGEDVTLSVTVQNQGPVPLAAGFQGTLSTTAPGVTITQSKGTFPAIGSSASGTTASPHFLFRTSPTTACGTSIPFTLTLGPRTDSFSVTVGSQSPGSPVTLLNEPFAASVATFPSSSLPGWTANPASGSVGRWYVPGYQVYNCGTTSNFALTSPYTSQTVFDAWAFTPGIAMTAGTTYTLTFNQRVGYSGALDPGENFELRVGTTASSAMTTSLFNQTGLKNATCTLRTVTYAPTTSGTYYFGFRNWRVNDAGTHTQMIVDDVKVTSPGAPICNMTDCSSPAGVPAEVAATTPTALRFSGATEQNLSWGSSASAELYRIYRGGPADLPALLSGTADSCLRWTGTGTETGTVLSEDATSGGFYWFLVTGVNGAGEGTSGNSTAGPRLLDSRGDCP